MKQDLFLKQVKKILFFGFFWVCLFVCSVLVFVCVLRKQFVDFTVKKEKNASFLKEKLKID